MKKSSSKNNISTLLVIIGLILIGFSLIIVVHNIYTDYKGKKNSQKALTSLQEVISNDSSYDEREELSTEKNVTENARIIDGKKYMGIITIPKIGVKLPVLDNWDSNNLNIAPCRYFGNVYENNLIIAAHNYASFFAKIDRLNSGDLIKFTDAQGIEHNYEVSNTEIIDGKNASAMKENMGQWDITLFTCTWSGFSRVAVRAVCI